MQRQRKMRQGGRAKRITTRIKRDITNFRSKKSKKKILKSNQKKKKKKDLHIEKKKTETKT